MPRLTIKDIASRAGVSTGAVSYALNGRGRISEATRARVLAVAEDLGWTPNNAARGLAGSRSETVGLVLPAGTATTLGVSPFFMEFIGGVERVLVRHSYGLLLQVVAEPGTELTTYRKWQSSRRVDGVMLVDVRVDDPRIAAVQHLQLPAVVAGPPEVAGGLSCVWTDDASAVREAVRYLVALGHRSIARIGGSVELAHSRIRQAAFDQETRALGVEAHTVPTDFSIEQGTRASRQALLRTPRPTALLYDDDLNAVAGLGVARELGLSVPRDVSLLAWDDSLLCQITYPQLSAMSHDVQAYGDHVARRLFDVLDGAEPAAHLDATPVIRPRASTGPPPS